MDGLAAFLAGYGALLSTTLAYREIRRSRRGHIALTAEWYAPADQLQVEIVNIGPATVTVRAVEVIYGANSGDALILYTIPNAPAQLEQGKLLAWEVPRQFIVEGRERALARLDRRNLVWVRVHLRGIGEKISAVKIDTSAIGAAGIFRPAEQFFAADLFVGFPREDVLKQRRDVPMRTTR